MILGKIRHLIKGNQKGDVFVMAAASMAAVMFCSAAVVDLGSLYSHKSKLQNAADAAALAGAHAFADNEETVADHPEADSVAETYVELNLGEDSPANRTFKARSKNDAIYYRVVLEDDAPTYFYRYFFKDPPRISVESIASINENENGSNPPNSNNGNGGNVFIFKDSFDYAQQTAQGGIGKILTTFDGKVSWTDGTGDYNPSYNPNYISYSTTANTYGDHYFYTKKAQNEDKSAADILAIGDRFENGYASTMSYMQYDMDELGRYVRAQLNLSNEMASPPQTPDWRLWQTDPQKAQEQQTAYEKQQTAYKDYVSQNFIEGKVFRSSELNMSKNLAVSSKDGNLEITIDSTIPGNPDDPVYIYIDPGVNNHLQINVSKEASNYNDHSRPIVFCYTGNTNFNFDMDDGTKFRGVVYAPHLSGYINLSKGNHSTFEGSMISNGFRIGLENVNFIANSFGIPCLGSNYSGNGNGGTSGGKTSGNESTPTKNIHLSDPPDDINWND